MRQLESIRPQPMPETKRVKKTAVEKSLALTIRRTARYNIKLAVTSIKKPKFMTLLRPKVLTAGSMNLYVNIVPQVYPVNMTPISNPVSEEYFAKTRTGSSITQT